MQNNYNKDNDWNYKKNYKDENKCKYNDDKYDSYDEDEPYDNEYDYLDSKKIIFLKMMKKCKYNGLIEFNSRIFLFYNNDIKFRNSVNKIIEEFDAKLNIQLSGCKIYKNKDKIDTNNLTKVHTLNLNSYKGITNVGNLKKLKKLTINEGVADFHLLSELDELIFKVHKPLNQKTIGEIKKLRRKNPNVKIDIIFLTNYTSNIFNIISGTASIKFSN